jgi:hypothetical protein
MSRGALDFVRAVGSIALLGNQPNDTFRHDVRSLKSNGILRPTSRGELDDTREPLFMRSAL